MVHVRSLPLIEQGEAGAGAERGEWRAVGLAVDRFDHGLAAVLREAESSVLHDRLVIVRHDGVALFRHPEVSFLACMNVCEVDMNAFVAVTSALLVSLAEGVGNLVENCSDATAAIANVKLLLEISLIVHALVGPAATLMSREVDRRYSCGRCITLATLLRNLNELDAAGQGLAVLLDCAQEGVGAEFVGDLSAAPVDVVVGPGFTGADLSCMDGVLFGNDLALELDGSDGCDEAAGGNRFDVHSKNCWFIL